MSRATKLATLLVVFVFLGLSFLFVSAANPPEPTYGTADVDGSSSEWDTTNDFFANMYKAANPSFEVLSKLYLRYDCGEGVLYALSLASYPVTRPIAVMLDDAFVKIDDVKVVDGNSGDNDVPPDFRWINQVGNKADGWEASASMSPPPVSYTLNVHNNVCQTAACTDTDTGAVANRAIELLMVCAAPTATPTATPTLTPSPTPTATDTPGPSPTPTPNGYAGDAHTHANGYSGATYANGYAS